MNKQEILKKDIAHSIENSRQELLDIGLRGNSLIHFKTTALSITIVDEISRDIFKLLVEDQKKISFIPSNKEAQDEEINFSKPQPELFDEQKLKKNTRTAVFKQN